MARRELLGSRPADRAQRIPLRRNATTARDETPLGELGDDVVSFRLLLSLRLPPTASVNMRQLSDLRGWWTGSRYWDDGRAGQSPGDVGSQTGGKGVARRVRPGNDSAGRVEEDRQLNVLTSAVLYFCKTLQRDPNVRVSLRSFFLCPFSTFLETVSLLHSYLSMLMSSIARTVLALGLDSVISFRRWSGIVGRFQ